MAVLSWWHRSSPHYGRDALICDGAVRSGKTFCMSLSFVLWSFYAFDGADLALCGKTINSLRRNMVTPVIPLLQSLGFSCEEKLSRNILLVRCGFSLGEGSALKKLVYGTLKLLSRVRSVEGWKKKADAIQTRYNHLDTVTVTNMGGSYSYERESHPRAQLEKTVLHPFEQGQYRIPEGYDDLLRRCYGDYMQLPPEDKRVGIHQVQGVDFGSYQIRSRL